MLNRISETIQVTVGRMLASPWLDHGERTTPVIVGWFAVARLKITIRGIPSRLNYRGIVIAYKSWRGPQVGDAWIRVWTVLG